MTKSKKLKTPKFPDTITVMDHSADYYERGELGQRPKLKIVSENFEPQPGITQVQATYKLVGVEAVSSKLLVTRKQVKPRK